jgi:aquaporin Z
LTFLWLKKIEPWDALFYMLAQFLGALAGVLLVAALLGKPISDPAVNYVVTVPGPSGLTAAFLAEFVISFGLMFEVLVVSNIHRLAHFTDLLAGLLLALYIAVEAPFSGMSMSPARTFASTLAAHLWTALWIYFTAPPLGMLLAAVFYLWIKGRPVFYAKLHHHNDKRCIFRHGPQVGRKVAVQS